MRKNVILFDIDGTILNLKLGLAYNIFVDTINEVYNIGINQSNLPTFHGKTDLQILADIELSFDLAPAFLTAGATNLWGLLFEKFKLVITQENIELLPGILELINILSSHDEYALGLVTGNFKQNAYLKLQANSLDRFFPFGGFGCDNPNRNQLPKLALERARDLGLIAADVSEKNAIIIGDTLHDINCGKDNNIPVLAVATGTVKRHVLQELHPDYLLDDLRDVRAVFSLIDNHFKNI